MALFKKRRHVGDFVPPEPQELAPLDDVVEDALKIAYHGVRMAVKNHLIVNALRDRKAFDEGELEAVAREEYLALAASNREAAVRARESLAKEREDNAGRVYPGGKPVVVEPDHLRKPEALMAVAEAYEEAAEDAALLRRLVDEAKAAAWDEVGGALSARLRAGRVDLDPDYAAKRGERIASFIAEELARLAPVTPAEGAEGAE